MKFDEILTEIGEFGRYQQYVFALACVPNLLAGFFLLNPVILLATPLHRCAIPGLDNDTYAVQDGYHAFLINLTIPPSDKEETYDRCQIYVPQSGDTLLEHSNVSKSRCERWVYDASIYENTYVSELDLVCDKEIWAANASMLLYCGMLVGSILCGILADRFGRKLVMYVSMFLMTVSSLGLAWPYNFAVMAVLQFINGGATVASFMAVYIISLEITGVSKRLYPGVLENIPYIAGLLLYVAIAYGFRTIMSIQLTVSLPGVVLIAYWWLMPESPRWLLLRGRVAEGEAILRKAARWNKTTYPEGAFDSQLVEELRQEKTGTNFTSLISSRTMFVRTLIVCFNWLVASFCYYGLALNTWNLNGDFYLNFFLSSLVEVPAYFFVMATLDKLGRRPIYILVMATGGISCVSTLLAVEYAKEISILPVLLSMVGRLGVTAGFTVLYVHSAEIFPTTARNAGMGLASMSARAGSMTAPYLVKLGTSIGGSFGRALPLIAIGVLAILSAVATIFLPETVNKHLPDTVDDSKHLKQAATGGNDKPKI